MREPWFNRHLGISMALIFLGLFVFGIAAYSAITESLLFRFDYPIANTMMQLNNTTSQLFKDIAALLDTFGNVGTDIIGFLLIGLFLFRRDWRKASLVFSGLPLAGLVWLGIVYLVGRSRPEAVYLPFFEIPLPSFPSGHVWTVTSFYGILLYMYWPKIHSTALRVGLIVLYVLFDLFIGFVRLFHLGHFFTDVLGGYGGGLAWMVLAILVVEAYFSKEARGLSTESPTYSR